MIHTKSRHKVNDGNQKIKIIV